MERETTLRQDVLGDETLFEKPSRRLNGEAQEAAWETAKAFGLTVLLNICADATFDRFVSGVEMASGYLKGNAASLEGADYGAYLLAALKTAIASTAKLYKAAYMDMRKALSQNEKAAYDAPDMRVYFAAADAKAKEDGDFTTTRYAYEPDETVRRLQEALALAGCNDMLGETLAADGIFGPKTYYAALSLARR
jgi:hypothetical protein